MSWHPRKQSLSSSPTVQHISSEDSDWCYGCESIQPNVKEGRCASCAKIPLRCACGAVIPEGVAAQDGKEPLCRSCEVSTDVALDEVQPVSKKKKRR